MWLVSVVVDVLVCVVSYRYVVVIPLYFHSDLRIIFLDTTHQRA